MKFIKNNIHYIIITIILVTYVLSFTSCNNNRTPANIDAQILNVDTIVNKYDADAKFFEVSREYNLLVDSTIILNARLAKAYNDINAIKFSRDSAIKASITNNEKLGIAEYKLLRIREYNRIAAQGNNLKYLRGWINRVIAH